MQARNLSETRNTYFQMLEAIPAQAYMSAAFGSMLLSLLLRLFGKKDAASFVSQWPTTLLLMALVYKLLRPSREDPARDSREAVRQASHLITTTH
jgi:hypothetical protein